jgi:hypothetical protein
MPDEKETTVYRKAINELLEYIETGRPSLYAPWRECDKEQMARILEEILSEPDSVQTAKNDA